MKKIKYLNQATIDLRINRDKEYRKMGILPKYTKTQKIVIIIGLILIIMNIIPKFETSAYTAPNMSIQDKIRLERLEVCQKAYNKSGINEEFLYGQIPAVRCATYMTLVYAFESDFGKSLKCKNKNNCWGIKGNGVDTPQGFLKFENYTKGREYFAKKYFRWHYKKNIRTFVSNRSMTDIENYIYFVEKNYFKIYGELEKLYLTSR